MIKNLYLYILCLSKIFNKRVWRDHPAPVPVLRQYCRQVICQTSTITAMNEEKQPVANPPPTAPPTAYTPGRTHSPPQYVNPPQGAHLSSSVKWSWSSQLYQFGHQRCGFLPVVQSHSLIWIVLSLVEQLDIKTANWRLPATPMLTSCLAWREQCLCA